MTTQTQPANLDELLAAVRAGRYTEQEMTALPTFGGDVPASTSNVWSWDASRLLVQDLNGGRGFCLVPRSEA